MRASLIVGSTTAAILRCRQGLLDLLPRDHPVDEELEIFPLLPHERIDAVQGASQEAKLFPVDIKQLPPRLGRHFCANVPRCKKNGRRSKLARLVRQIEYLRREERRVEVGNDAARYFLTRLAGEVQGLEIGYCQGVRKRNGGVVAEGVEYASLCFHEV